MGVARSSCYAAPAAANADAALVAKMRAITDTWECYGYRRVGAELRHRGWIVNGKKGQVQDTCNETCARNALDGAVRL